jgi:simple sugar transport system ATP-binding protein
VALVSHKLDEVLRATDEVTIMRSGQVVERMTTSEADAPGLARAMVGREVSLRSSAAALGIVEGLIDSTDQSKTPAAQRGRDPVLTLTNVVVDSPERENALDTLSLEVYPAEIVGVAGVEGNGQEELTALMSSLKKAKGGTVKVEDRLVDTGVAGSMARAGVAVVPADRHDSGVVLDLTVAENLFLVEPEQVARRGLWDTQLMGKRARELISEFEIQTSGPDAPLWSLSGGNQQRVVLARELSHSPKVLIASQPTRGLDVGAIEYISNRIRQAKLDGVGVLLISSELEEILDLADRIVVLFRGKIIGEMERNEVDMEKLGLLMGGMTEDLVKGTS